MDFVLFMIVTLLLLVPDSEQFQNRDSTQARPPHYADTLPHHRPEYQSNFPPGSEFRPRASFSTETKYSSLPFSFKTRLDHTKMSTYFVNPQAQSPQTAQQTEPTYSSQLPKPFAQPDRAQSFHDVESAQMPMPDIFEYRDLMSRKPSTRIREKDEDPIRHVFIHSSAPGKYYTKYKPVVTYKAILVHKPDDFPEESHVNPFSEDDRSHRTRAPTIVYYVLSSQQRGDGMSRYQENDLRLPQTFPPKPKLMHITYRTGGHSEMPSRWRDSFESGADYSVTARPRHHLNLNSLW